jgi:hypothetical protein
MPQIRRSRLLGLGSLFLLSALLIGCGSGPAEPNPPADSSLAGPPGGLRELSANVGPAVQIEKATNGFDADSAPGPNIPEGDPVEWTYVVTNTGGTDLSKVSVRDNKLGLVGCPKIGLAIGASMMCRASGTAAAGQYANLAKVTAEDAHGTEVWDEDTSHYFGAGDQLAAIKIEKETNGEDADFGPGPTILVGETVTWNYVVRNEGTLPLAGVTVTDDQGVLVICPQDTLAVGEAMTCTAMGTAEAGDYMNLGTANATFEGQGGFVSDTDPSHYFGADPQVDIEKATNGVDADIPPGPGICVGGAILWTYKVTNTGNVPLTDVQVDDQPPQRIVCPKEDLGPEESMTCTADGTAPAQVGEQYGNLGSVVAWALEGVRVDDEDPSHYISVENTPPVCSDAFASQETLWPPNHKFVAIEVLGVVDPDGNQVSITIDSIHQDEPVNGEGDGNTSPDGRGVGTETARVRAERAGPGNGRVYHIGFTAYDGCDGFCSGEIEVGVPHDNKDVPVDEGAAFDSTAR